MNGTQDFDRWVNGPGRDPWACSGHRDPVTERPDPNERPARTPKPIPAPVVIDGVTHTYELVPYTGPVTGTPRITPVCSCGDWDWISNLQVGVDPVDTWGAHVTSERLAAKAAEAA